MVIGLAFAVLAQVTPPSPWWLTAMGAAIIGVTGAGGAWSLWLAIRPATRRFGARSRRIPH